MTAERTLVCPACGSCFCKAPRAYKLDFWSRAPGSLWERKRAEKKHKEVLPPNPLPSEVKRPLVLICEDEDDIARMAVTSVESLGYGWVLARDGVEGLSLAKEYRPDVVLTDALMPKLDGREMCRRLKADPDTRDLRIAVMTSLYTSSKYRSEALSFGADDYLAKPFERTQLAELLRKLAPLPGAGTG